MIETLNAFPQKILRFNYEGDLSLYTKELYNIKNSTPNFFLEKGKSHTQFQTSFKFFEEYKFFTPIRNYLISNLEPFFNKKFLINSSWANIYSKNGYAFPHTHANSDISGVLYLQIIEDDKLVIVNKNDINDYVEIFTQNGLILLFDSSQPHYTYPNFTSQDKIVIAFNIKFIE